MERRVSRFFVTNTGAKVEGFRFGYVQQYAGGIALIEEVIMKELAEAASFVQQALQIGSMEEVWGMNIYEFCRAVVEARRKQAQDAERLEKQKTKWQT
jgi:hypothetical protein